MAEIDGGILDLAAPTALGSAGIDFAPASTGILRIEGSAAPSDTISGFTSGDLIDLAGLGYAGATAATIDGNTVTITEGSVSETLTITGASTEPLLITSDGGDGTEVQIPCYCSGTRILTDQGEVAVEALAVGDRVITLSGAAQPIIWIGRRAYAGRFLAGRGHLLPVRIRAGALGGGLPRRDLLVSPSHAMFIDALLIPSGQLVNGSSIVQERGWTRVDYVHVELASHTVIWAEGALSETYLDEGDREMFENAAEYGERRGTQAVRSCALRVESGFELELVRRRLAQVG